MAVLFFCKIPCVQELYTFKVWGRVIENHVTTSEMVKEKKYSIPAIFTFKIISK
jgi:hypothetical protein